MIEWRRKEKIRAGEKWDLKHNDSKGWEVESSGIIVVVGKVLIK